jgi:hypothetical protein
MRSTGAAQPLSPPLSPTLYHHRYHNRYHHRYPIVTTAAAIMSQRVWAQI